MTQQEAFDQGYRWVCMFCRKIYKNKPSETYEDGHGGRPLDMCSCGCDLFDSIKGVTKDDGKST